MDWMEVSTEQAPQLRSARSLVGIALCSLIMDRSIFLLSKEFYVARNDKPKSILPTWSFAADPIKRADNGSLISIWFWVSCFAEWGAETGEKGSNEREREEGPSHRYELDPERRLM